MNETVQINEHETIIQVKDIDDARHLLEACGNYFRALDVSNAQVELRSFSLSPLSLEIQKVKERFDGYLGDYLLHRHESDLEPENDLGDESPEDVVSEAPEASETPSQAPEKLSDNPLGSKPKPKSPRKVVAKGTKQPKSVQPKSVIE